MYRAHGRRLDSEESLVRLLEFRFLRFLSTTDRNHLIAKAIKYRQNYRQSSSWAERCLTRPLPYFSSFSALDCSSLRLLRCTLLCELLLDGFVLLSPPRRHP
jgi:hypothetical protein